jgi:hypothetical protein
VPPVRTALPPLALVVLALAALVPPEVVELPPVLMTLQLRMAEPGGPLQVHSTPDELVHESPGVEQEVPWVQSAMPLLLTELEDWPPDPP